MALFVQVCWLSDCGHVYSHTVNARVTGALAIALATAMQLSAAPADAETRGTRGTRALGEAFRAFRAGDYRTTYNLRRRLDRGGLANRDYADYAVGQSALLLGDVAEAQRRFARLASNRRSRFADTARWRLADCDWQAGDLRGARQRYARLLAAAARQRQPAGDLGLARYRVATALAQEGMTERAVAEYRGLWMQLPAHPLADDARAQARRLGGDDAVALSVSDRIARADRLTEQKKWRTAVLELDAVAGPLAPDQQDKKNLQLGRTLFKMRRQYEMAGRLLLDVWPRAGRDSDWALFHGARALSRAHRDREAIGWYQKGGARFPRSEWAGEAQYLAGWLEFNLGNYEAAVPHLRRMLRRYPPICCADSGAACAAGGARRPRSCRG